MTVVTVQCTSIIRLMDVCVEWWMDDCVVDRYMCYLAGFIQLYVRYCMYMYMYSYLSISVHFNSCILLLGA